MILHLHNDQFVNVINNCIQYSSAYSVNREKSTPRLTPEQPSSFKLVFKGVSLSYVKTLINSVFIAYNISNHPYYSQNNRQEAFNRVSIKYINDDHLLLCVVLLLSSHFSSCYASMFFNINYRLRQSDHMVIKPLSSHQ